MHQHFKGSVSLCGCPRSIPKHQRHRARLLVLCVVFVLVFSVSFTILIPAFLGSVPSLNSGPKQAPKYFYEVWHLAPNGKSKVDEKRDYRFGNHTLVNPFGVVMSNNNISRFYNGNRTLEIEDRLVILRNLFAQWSAFCTRKNITYWLVHGTLLGWHWGQKIMPWDEDIDLQMKFSDLRQMSKYHQVEIAPNVMFELNPNYLDRTIKKGDNNVIDARLFDMTMGYFLSYF